MSSCSMLSLEAQEPMIASTLENIHHWVLVEQPKAWPARPGVDDLDVTESQRAMIQQALLKKKERDAVDSKLVFDIEPYIFMYREQTVYCQ